MIQEAQAQEQPLGQRYCVFCIPLLFIPQSQDRDQENYTKNVLTERILAYATHQNTDPRKGYVYLWNNQTPQEATYPAVKYCDSSTLIYQTASMNLPPKDSFHQDKYVWANASTISGPTQVITNSPACK